ELERVRAEGFRPRVAQLLQQDRHALRLEPHVRAGKEEELLLGIPGTLIDRRAHAAVGAQRQPGRPPAPRDRLALTHAPLVRHAAAMTQRCRQSAKSIAKANNEL